MDDYKRWTWVKFLRNKNEKNNVFSNFCTHIQIVEKNNISLQKMALTMIHETDIW